MKADGYGHGAADVGRAALEAGATALCVATVPEGAALRRALPEPRILVLGPSEEHELAEARAARLEVTVADGPLPTGIPVHLKLDTGMGRWGMSELPTPGRDVVGVMSHLASADCDAEFTAIQIERFARALQGLTPLVTRHLANSAAALRFPAARFDAARCGIAIYGLSPFGTDPADDGLEPALRWESRLAQVKLLRPGDSTGYGRRFVAERRYLDRNRPRRVRGRLPTRPQRHRRRRRRRALPASVGTISMDAFAVELPRQLPVGTPVTLIGPGAPAEAHARVAETISYELVTGIDRSGERAHRTVTGA